MDEEEEECRVGWFSVQSGSNSRLCNPQLLKYALQVMGRNPSDRAIEGYWLQCGGSMSYQQFSLVMQREKKTSMAHLMHAFRKMDLKNDGFITFQELQRNLTKRGEKMSLADVEAILAEVDRNGDGRLDYTEFCHIFLNTATECFSAIRQKTVQMAAERDARTSRTHANKSKTMRNGGDRKMSAQRRLSRRKEITKQLYSSEDTVSSSNSKFKAKALSGAKTSQYQGLRLPCPSSSTSPPATMMEDFLQRKEQKGKAEKLSLPLVSRISHTTAYERSLYGGHQHIETSDKEGGNFPGVSNTQHVLPTSRLLPLKMSSLPSVVPGGGGVVSVRDGCDEHKQTVRGSVAGGGDSAGGGSGDDVKSGSDNGARGGSGDGARGGSGDGVGGGSGDHVRSGSDNGARSGSGDGARGGSDDGAGSDGGTVGGSGDGAGGRSGGGTGGGSAGVRCGSGDDAVDGSSDCARDGSGDGVGSGNGAVGGTGDGVSGSGGKNTNVYGSLSDSVDQTSPESDVVGSEDGSGEKGTAMETIATSTSVTRPPPRKPKNIQDWYSISGKGCFYFDLEQEYPSSCGHEGRLIKCHHYYLTLPVSTSVWVEAEVASPGVQVTDVLLFVCQVNDQEEATDVITYTQHKIGTHWVCHIDLEAGQYALLPYTSGCHLKAVEEDSNYDHKCSTHGAESKSLTTTGTGGDVLLSLDCTTAFQEIFDRIDLDGNGSISRTEFDFFNEVTCGEVCDDDAWGIIQAHFDMTHDDEVSLQGFLALHEMAAADPEGGEEELWQCLQAMGYNQQLQLTQACPYLFAVWSEKCEGELEIVDLLPFAPLLHHTICRWVLEGGVVVPVQGVEEGELSVHSFSASNLTTLVVENQSMRTVHVQLDVSQSVNCVCNRLSTVHVLEIPAQATKIGYHLQPADVHAPHTVTCIASKILS